MQKTFEALASTPRRKILAYLSHGELNAGEIAARFDMTKPAVSKHLSILENAGLVVSEKRRQFVYYRLIPENLVDTLNSYMQEVCPVSQSLEREIADLSSKGDRQTKGDGSELPSLSGERD